METSLKTEQLANSEKEKGSERKKGQEPILENWHLVRCGFSIQLSRAIR